MSVTFTKIDAVHTRITGDDGILDEISKHFTFEPENKHFHPLVRGKKWDGKIRLFNKRTKLLPNGLVNAAARFVEANNYTVMQTDGSSNKRQLTPLSINELEATFLNELSLPNAPRDYQLEALRLAGEQGNVLFLSPTASGKSLIIYLIMEYFKDAKFLLVVPTLNLVEQMKGDLIDYGMDPNDLSLLFQGQEHINLKRVTISTWQSLLSRPPEWFEQFDGVCVDEVHGATSKSFKYILGSLKNAYLRFGFTGTLKDIPVHEMTLRGYFGDIHKTSTTKELIDRGILSQLTLHLLLIKHPEEDIIKRSYEEEITFLIGNNRRNRAITKLAISLPGNTLVLFARIEKHGDLLKKMIEDQGKFVNYVHGLIDKDDREVIRQLIMSNNEYKICLSFGDIEIKIPTDEKVPLSNGIMKLAKDITENDDIDTDWIHANSKSSK